MNVDYKYHKNVGKSNITPIAMALTISLYVYVFMCVSFVSTHIIISVVCRISSSTKLYCVTLTYFLDVKFETFVSLKLLKLAQNAYGDNFRFRYLPSKGNTGTTVLQPLPTF